MENVNIKEIADKIEMMKQIISSFTGVLEQENAALKSNDIKTVKSLYEQKIKAVVAYRTACAFFIKNQNIVAEYISPQKDELKELSVKLDVVLKENELLLKTRMDAGKAVMNTFVQVAKMANNKQATAYGAKGGYALIDNQRNALAFNRTM